VTAVDAFRLVRVSENIPEAVDQVRRLLQEYERELDVDLCFQGFEEELRSLPGAYGGRRARLLAAYLGREIVGCVALRELDRGTAELKRLFVRPAARGSGLGRRLVNQVLKEASGLGYQRVRLDTLPSMAAARSLYRDLGFREIAAYTVNPVDGAAFMELALAEERRGRGGWPASLR
jgi:ribosomal protein S18 acetylase RimI-like enzyme